METPLEAKIKRSSVALQEEQRQMQNATDIYLSRTKTKDLEPPSFYALEESGGSSASVIVSLPVPHKKEVTLPSVTSSIPIELSKKPEESLHAFGYPYPPG
jgi:hypothetical protein